jgi:WhiB family redox-sensing transcriptional regulator
VTTALLRENILNTEKWVRQALCVETDPELFFPSPGRAATEAKRICESCPVREQCLQYALTNQEIHGIWGGLSPRERDALRRGRPRHCPHGPLRATACRECARERDRRYRERRRIELPPGSGAKHGTLTRYSYGCRCSPCCTAKRVDNGVRYERERQERLRRKGGAA